MAACGGLLLGYDNGVTGGVVSLESFEKKVRTEVAGEVKGLGP